MKKKYKKIPNIVVDRDLGPMMVEDLNTLELEAWIRDHMERLIPGLLSKAQEYGSSDLEMIGEGLKHLLPDIEASEILLGINFYLLGKVARIQSQIAAGKDPKDSFLDVHLYALIALRIIEEGKWY